jgi:glyoxylase-like metal-dependent hydrolase (beta-lactamase superfamily II)
MAGYSAVMHEPSTDPDLVLLERGWLSSNNVLLRSETHALLIDSGHARHVEQTLALVQHGLAGLPLHGLVNTHLHSDHCGGNARLQAVHALQVAVPPGHAQSARTWDVDALGYRPTGQMCPRFQVDAVVQPGAVVVCGRWRFEALAAPGHDPHALIFFDAASGTLISGDALWQDGFGVVFPELDAQAGFADVAATLDLIELLPVREVLPGHGARFGDVPAALARARARLASHERNPPGHARHAAKVLVKYHLMELGEQPLAELQAWLASTPLLGSCQQRCGVAGSQLDFGLALFEELCQRGALAVRDGVAHDL